MLGALGAAGYFFLTRGKVALPASLQLGLDGGVLGNTPFDIPSALTRIGEGLPTGPSYRRVRAAGPHRDAARNLSERRGRRSWRVDAGHGRECIGPRRFGRACGGPGVGRDSSVVGGASTRALRGLFDAIPIPRAAPAPEPKPTTIHKAAPKKKITHHRRRP